jgi:hypothetical protein
MLEDKIKFSDVLSRFMGFRDQGIMEVISVFTQRLYLNITSPVSCFLDEEDQRLLKERSIEALRRYASNEAGMKLIQKSQLVHSLINENPQNIFYELKREEVKSLAQLYKLLVTIWLQNDNDELRTVLTN